MSSSSFFWISDDYIMKKCFDIFTYEMQLRDCWNYQMGKKAEDCNKSLASATGWTPGCLWRGWGGGGVSYRDHRHRKWKILWMCFITVSHLILPGSSTLTPAHLRLMHFHQGERWSKHTLSVSLHRSSLLLRLPLLKTPSSSSSSPRYSSSNKTFSVSSPDWEWDVEREPNKSLQRGKQFHFVLFLKADLSMVAVSDNRRESEAAWCVCLASWNITNTAMCVSVTTPFVY